MCSIPMDHSAKISRNIADIGPHLRTHPGAFSIVSLFRLKADARDLLIAKLGLPHSGPPAHIRSALILSIADFLSPAHSCLLRKWSQHLCVRSYLNNFYITWNWVGFTIAYSCRNMALSSSSTSSFKAIFTGLLLLSPSILMRAAVAQDANDTEVQSAQMRFFAVQSGVQAAEEEPDYTCDESNPCKLGCCGSV